MAQRSDWQDSRASRPDSRQPVALWTAGERRIEPPQAGLEQAEIGERQAACLDIGIVKIRRRPVFLEPALAASFLHGLFQSPGGREGDIDPKLLCFLDQRSVERNVGGFRDLTPKFMRIIYAQLECALSRSRATQHSPPSVPRTDGNSCSRPRSAARSSPARPSARCARMRPRNATAAMRRERGSCSKNKRRVKRKCGNMGVSASPKRHSSQHCAWAMRARLR